ncbi:MAG TPA: hypothetical protein VLE27_13140 [Thermoanaerobaculia bacterium]|nr:hypothetical protein [Thermoanaerobaculia bacterium]
MSPKAIIAVLCVLFPSIAVAAEAPETLLAQRLLEIPQLKDEIAASAGRSVPTGTASEISMALFRSDERIWTALVAELPPLLATRIPRKRLEALVRSYGENPEGAWSESGAEIMALVRSLMAGDSQLRKEVVRTSCSAGILAPNIDAAREKNGTADTPFKAPPDFFEMIQPFLPSIDETCACIVRRGAETSGEKFFSDQMPREERAALVAQLITTGKCPDPFAAMR